jgi:hypothetical protein
MALIDCPASNCRVQHDEDDLLAQTIHMDSYHPEIITQRRQEAGFRQDPVTGLFH